jgi:hypothetical protein
MPETLFYVLSNFWVGAVHAATPGHGKTIAAAYIVGARGRPIDAVILGVFVTLSHTTGGVLASLGSGWLVPQRVEAYLALRRRARAMDAMDPAKPHGPAMGIITPVTIPMMSIRTAWIW